MNAIRISTGYSMSFFCRIISGLLLVAGFLVMSTQASLAQYCDRNIYNQSSYPVEVTVSGEGTWSNIVEPGGTLPAQYHNDVLSISLDFAADAKNYAGMAIASFRFSGWGDNRDNREDVGLIPGRPSCYWAHEGNTQMVVLNEPENGDIIITNP